MSGISKVLGAAILGGSIVAAGFYVGQGLSVLRQTERVVSVRGLAERDVQADSATWTLGFTTSGNVLADVQAKSQADKKLVEAFLNANGLTAEDITSSSVRVSDATANQYLQQQPVNRFVMENSVSLRTSKVQAVKAAYANVADLIGKGVLLTDGSAPAYSFTKLNDIKPEMLAESTKNARAAAEQFAADSGSKVGNIRNASQGLFSIAGVDETLGDTAQINKRVRVVNMVDYLLE